MIKKLFIFVAVFALALIPIARKTKIIYAAGNYSRTGNTVNFSFDDWSEDMDFVDIEDNNQTYWWIEAGSNSEEELEEYYYEYSECFSSATFSGSKTFTFPTDEAQYPLAVHIQAASSLENCEAQYGGEVKFGGPAYAGTDSVPGISFEEVNANPTVTALTPILTQGTASISDSLFSFLPYIFIPAIILGVLFAVYYGLKTMSKHGPGYRSHSPGKSAAVNKKRYATIFDASSRTSGEKIQAAFRNPKDRNAFMKSYRRHIAKQGRESKREISVIRKKMMKYS